MERTFESVQLYEGTNVVAVAGTAPFTLVWTNIALGAHEVRLRATDTNGGRYLSAPILIEAVEASASITLKLTLDSSGPALEFSSENGARYNVQYSADLQTWLTDPNALESSTGTIRWVDDGPPHTQTHPSTAPIRFYRLVLQP